MCECDFVCPVTCSPFRVVQSGSGHASIMPLVMTTSVCLENDISTKMDGLAFNCVQTFIVPVRMNPIYSDLGNPLIN